MNGTNQQSPLVLRAASEGEGTPLPLGLEGYPLADSEGGPIFYRKMRIARAGAWTHRGTGEPVTITQERMDEWARNTAALSGAGVRPFLPGQHREEFNAADNHGYVLSVNRDGEDLYATVALYGEEAKRIAAVNSRSIYVVKDARDAKGNVVPGESIAHVALVPNPALPDLGPTVKIAASAGGSAAIEAPILEPAAETNRSNPMFKPETLKNLRTKLKLPDTAPEADVAEQVAALALAEPKTPDPAPEVARLSADVKRIEKERDDAKSEAQRATLALSASAPKEPDALTLSLTLDAFNTKREQAIASGSISEAGMKAIDALLMPGGKPNGVALSLSGDGVSARPLYARLCEIIAANPGVKSGNAVKRDGVTVAMPLALSGDAPPDPATVQADARKEGEAWQARQLQGRQALSA